jgi:hypothetical protein
MNFDEFAASSKEQWLIEAKKLFKGEDITPYLTYKPSSNLEVPAYQTVEDRFDKTLISVDSLSAFEICLPLSQTDIDSNTILTEGLDSVEYDFNGTLPVVSETLKSHIKLKDSSLSQLESDLAKTTGGTLTFKAADFNDLQNVLLSNAHKTYPNYRHLCVDMTLLSSENETDQLRKSILLAETLINSVGNSSSDDPVFQSTIEQGFLCERFKNSSP